MGELIVLQNEKTIEFWWEQLEAKEREVENIKRMLGILAVERGLEG